MIRWAFVALIVLHALIHLLGFTKAFGLYESPEMTQAIPRLWGLVWLGAFALMLATAVFFAMQWRMGWAVALVAVILSQLAIVSSWSDAKFGTIANVLVLVGVVYGVAARA